MLTQALLIHTSTACPFRCNIFCCCLVVCLHHSLDTGSIHAGYATNSCVSQMICVDRFHCSLECAMNQGPEHHVSACLSCLFSAMTGRSIPSEDISMCYSFSSTHVNTYKHTHIHMHAQMRTRIPTPTHTLTHTHTESYILPCHLGSYTLTSGET